MLTSGPIIWSETRQELCESLPYYRAYQTGCYVTGFSGRPPSSVERKAQHRSAVLKDSVPYGYLLAGWPSRRDAWAHDGQVIISHGGGKSEVFDAADAAETRKASLRQNQSSSDSTIRALLHSARHRLPMVLIAADNYALLPFRLACSYAVLGWYCITDCWAEREATDGDTDTGFVRWKFRFEWIPAQGEPWWLSPGDKDREWDPRQRIELFNRHQHRAAKQMRFREKRINSSRSGSADTSESSSRAVSESVEDITSEQSKLQSLLFGSITLTSKVISTVVSTPESLTTCNPTNSATCLICKQSSPIVFDFGWTCLHPECRIFFVLPPGKSETDSSLVFSSDFLSPLGTALDSVFPGGQPPFSLIPTRPPSTSMDQSRGLWCGKCGRLSCREVLFQPRCAHCGNPVGKWRPLPAVSPPVLSRHPFDFSSLSQCDFDPIISASSGIVMRVRTEKGLKIHTFMFPAIFGDCCVHLVQADIDGGATETEADQIFLGFQKHTWSSEDSNTGAKESARSDVRTEQPSQSSQMESINARRPQIIPFRRHVLRSHAGGPGRMLTQQFTCNYGVPYKHVVAMGTQSLSATESPSVILSTLDLLQSRTSAVLPASSASSRFGGFNELYPVLYLDHQKMSFHDDGEPGLGPVVSSLSLGSTCRMKFRLKQKYLAGFKDVSVKDKVVLNLPLRHGSVVIQEGADLQKHFEHCVSPDGFRIAVTARHIDPKENDRETARRNRGSGAAATAPRPKEEDKREMPMDTKARLDLPSTKSKRSTSSKQAPKKRAAPKTTNPKRKKPKHKNNDARASPSSLTPSPAVAPAADTSPAHRNRNSKSTNLHQQDLANRRSSTRLAITRSLFDT